MKRFVNPLLRRWFGLEIRNYKSFPGMVSLKPEGESKGEVLISYIIDPFLVDDESRISNSHTHHWESWLMAKAFLQMGYGVDVISFMDDRFVPQKSYTLFIAARTNFERLAKLLDKECIKVAHLDTAHWLYNNAAVLQRSLELQRSHGITLASFKFIEYNWAIEHADYATVLGNQFTVDTYSYANIPVYRIPISSCSSYPWSEEKDYERCRNNYLWFGSKGFVHKGLDLVLDAFARMPDHHLYVCGPMDDEPGFQEAFAQQLFHTPNIHTLGWVDVLSDGFLEVAGNCVGLVYPSSAEGGGGSVIQCMHAGVIPLVSNEASVDIADEYGVILEEFSAEEVMRRVTALSSLPAGELEQMSRRAWEFAREKHTRERFFEEFRRLMESIIANHDSGQHDGV